MKDYRIYLLESSGNFCGVHLATCLNDHDAVEMARPFLADCATVEVWDRGRLVGAIAPPKPTANLSRAS